MSFGFSVGDFFLAGSILVKIGATLRESTGSCADYQNLFLRFDRYEKLLKTVQVTCSHQELQNMRDIQELVNQCEALLQEFHTATEKYKRSLSPGGSGRKLNDNWRKVKWGMKKRVEVLELLDQFGKNMNAINVYLTCYGVCVVPFILPERSD
jgi:hypothetical protein